MRRTIVSLFFNNAFSACFFMQGDVLYTSTIVNANIRDGGNAMGWATEEFSEAQLGDKRLDTRLIKLFDTLSEAPESPINQACEDLE